MILAGVEMLVGFIISSSTHCLYQRCCDGLRVLPVCSYTYNRPLPVLDKHNRPFFLLNLPISPQEWSPLRSEMLANPWVVLLVNSGCIKGAVIVWEGFRSISIPITNLYQFCIRMIGLASTSTCHFPPECGPLRLRSEMLANFQVVLSPTGCTKGAVMYIGCFRVFR